MGTLNCLRIRAYAPTLTATDRDAAMDKAGNEIPRPSAKQSMSMFQPKPARGCPPSKSVMGMKTSSPSTVMGKCDDNDNDKSRQDKTKMRKYKGYNVHKPTHDEEI